MFAPLLVTLFSLLPPPAHAATALDRPVWLGATVDGGAGIGSTGSAGGGVAGLIGVALGKVPGRSFGIEARVGEAVYSDSVRTVGTIDFDVRFPAGSGPYGFAGFAHHHELGIDEAVGHPVGAIAATYSGITHRTGFELGGGWDVAPPFPNSSFGSRIRPTARIGITVLPDAVSPPVYITGTVGLLLGIGKVR